MRAILGLVHSGGRQAGPVVSELADVLREDAGWHRQGGPGWVLALRGDDRSAMASTAARDHLRVAVVGELLDGRAADAARRSHGSAALEAYQASGPEGLMGLNGSFAAAIIDTSDPTAPRVELVVDAIGGVHHLHYATFEGGIVFASHIRHILATGLVKAEADEQTVVDFFAHGHSLPPRTFFKGIHKVAPGTVISYERGGLSVRRIHQFRFDEEPGDDDTHVQRLEEALMRAVELRSQGASRVGAFLSGGLDSSVNVGLLHRTMGPGIETFSIAYPQSRYDESPYARLVAARFQTNHHELVLDSPALLDELPTMIWHLEEPTGDNSFVPTWALSRFAKGMTDVVLSGDGPDHLFGRHYPMAVAREALTRMPGAAALARLAGAAPGAWELLRGSRAGRHVWKTMRSASTTVLDAYLGIYEDITWGALSPARLGELLRPELLAHRNGTRTREDVSAAIDGLRAMEQMIALDVACDGAFGVFAKVGKMSAAHELSVREPYFDRDVVETICRLPARMRVRGSRGERLRNKAVKKFALRQVAEGLAPDEVLTKPKHGFEAPISDWLRIRLAGRPVERIWPQLTANWVRPEFARRLLEEHVSGLRDHGYMLFMLMTAELWCDVFLRSGGGQPSYTWQQYMD